MDILTIALLGSIFLFTATLVSLIFFIWNETRFAEKQTVKRRLLYVSAGGKHGQEKLKKYREKVLKDVGPFERLALKIPRVSHLDRLLLKAGVPITATIFILGSITLGAFALVMGLLFIPSKVAAAAIAVVALLAPYFMLKVAERSYYARFDEQLPEAIDLLARAVRSGHAITSGLEMVAEEMEDPIKTEMDVTVDEINLGLTMEEAFENLCERVPSVDLRFFTIAVLVQKETGGNIAEILDNISRLIRERIQFSRQVRVLTAEGRYSAAVLIALPILMFIYIYFVNYDYISLLWKDPIGHVMLGAGIILQIIGAFAIKRIVTIEI